MQPYNKLHSQLDHGDYSQRNKVGGREPLRIHPDDARARGIEDGGIVRVYNDRGACLAGVRFDPQLLRGVVQLATGAWWDPVNDGLDLHGNPNVLTQDIGSSSFSQGCSAQSCLVEVELFNEVAPPRSAYTLPTLVSRQ